mmetsp:Transcript_102144/g.288487  ORF Transcript_102144/g.288487 Transcript_102144/m.288487 type:complete len:385 (+) Transcript_102144:726-1880(+)
MQMLPLLPCGVRPSASNALSKPTNVLRRRACLSDLMADTSPAAAEACLIVRSELVAPIVARGALEKSGGKAGELAARTESSLVEASWLGDPPSCWWKLRLCSLWVPTSTVENLLLAQPLIWSSSQALMLSAVGLNFMLTYEGTRCLLWRCRDFDAKAAPRSFSSPPASYDTSGSTSNMRDAMLAAAIDRPSERPLLVADIALPSTPRPVFNVPPLTAGRLDLPPASFSTPQIRFFASSCGTEAYCPTCRTSGNSMVSNVRMKGTCRRIPSIASRLKQTWPLAASWSLTVFFSIRSTKVSMSLMPISWSLSMILDMFADPLRIVDPLRFGRDHSGRATHKKWRSSFSVSKEPVGRRDGDVCVMPAAPAQRRRPALLSGGAGIPDV